MRKESLDQTSEKTQHSSKNAQHPETEKKQNPTFLPMEEEIVLLPRKLSHFPKWHDLKNVFFTFLFR